MIYYSIENSDVVIIINQEVKADSGETYLTFKLLKRRYRSSEHDDNLKKLDYKKNSQVKTSLIAGTPRYIIITKLR